MTNKISTLRAALAEQTQAKDAAIRLWNDAGAELLTAQTALAERQAASVDDVIAERQRQINVEGWTPEHDDAHSNREMAIAAACYALAAAHRDYRLLGNPDFWPWDHKWWKPTTPRRDLVKAAALILAEIDRLDRSAARALVEGK